MPTLDGAAAGTAVSAGSLATVRLLEVTSTWAIDVDWLGWFSTSGTLVAPPAQPVPPTYGTAGSADPYPTILVGSRVGPVVRRISEVYPNPTVTNGRPS